MQVIKITADFNQKPVQVTLDRVESELIIPEGYYILETLSKNYSNIRIVAPTDSLPDFGPDAVHINNLSTTPRD